LSAVLVGCVAAALLAILLDQTIRLLESGLTARSRLRIGTAGAVLVGLFAWTGADLATARAAGPQLRIGAKTFTEQYVLSRLLASLVERRTGRTSEVVSSLGSTVAFDALRADEIDVYVDYSGTIWATIMKRGELPETRGEVLSQARRYLLTEHGVTVAASLGFENTYALAMRTDRAEALGIAKIGELSRVASRLAIGGDFEFFARAEWASLERVYGLRFREQRAMDASLMYQAVETGQVDVISAYSTDGRIAALDLTLLEDERGVIPPYDAIVLASPRLVREEPEVLEALRTLEGAIDAHSMQRMNLAVDRDGLSPAAVGAEFVADFAPSG
jgi:osmoprotectant transport system permease protein